MTEKVDVLLVEDNPNDVELTLRTFQKYRVTNNIQVVRDGAKALEYLFGSGAYAGRDINHKPKVILLDLKMPKVNGLEVLARLKADPRMKAIPVVVMTSSREEPDVKECYRLGVNRIGSCASSCQNVVTRSWAGSSRSKSAIQKEVSTKKRLIRSLPCHTGAHRGRWQIADGR
jgi:two-component system response regulator